MCVFFLSDFVICFCEQKFFKFASLNKNKDNVIKDMLEAELIGFGDRRRVKEGELVLSFCPGGI